MHIKLNRKMNRILWSKKELHILRDLVAVHGLTNGCTLASLRLGRTRSACVAKYYYDCNNVKKKKYKQIILCSA